jgi:multidrug efflux pump subunit AcrB
MRKVITFFVDRSFVVNLISAFVILIGTFAVVNMRRDLIPAMQFQYINISVSLPGASPIDLEKQVTFPIEEALNNLPDLEELKSETTNNYASITLKFSANNEDIDADLETVRARVEALNPYLPDSIKDIRIEQVKTDSVRFLFLALENIDQNSPVHRDWEKALRERIRRVTGIVQVESRINPLHLYIDFKPDRLEEYGISAVDIRRKLLAAITYLPVGVLKNDEDSYSIEIDQRINNPIDLAKLPIISNRIGDNVLLEDLANVELRFPDIESEYYLDGKPSISMRIYKDLNSDAIDLREEADTILKEFNKEAPDSISAHLVGDGPWFIERQLNALSSNGATGLLLVIILLFVFLGFRPALMTAWGIPICYFGTFAVLLYLKVSFDLVSVVGMLLIIGVVVDDAIIITERFIYNLQLGMQRREAAIEAAHSLMLPVTGTILTTVVAFSPILIIRNEMSTILFAIPIVVISALTLSWIECFFILPNHLKHFVSSPASRSKAIFEKLKEPYQIAIKYILRFRYLAFLALIVLFGVSIYISRTHIKQDFNVRVGSERIVIYAFLKNSPSLEHTKKAIQPIHDYLGSFPKEEIHHFSSQIGRTWFEGKHKIGNRYTQIWVFVPPRASNPGTLRDQLETKVKKKLKELKTDEFERLTLRKQRSDADEDKEHMITVHIGGSDKVRFDTIETEVRDLISKNDKIKEVYIDEDRLQENWRFAIDPEALEKYRVARTLLAAQISEAFQPIELERIRVGGETITVYTQMERKEVPTFASLNQLKVVASNGVAIPIHYLGKWHQVKTLQKIEHFDLMRTLKIDVKFDPEKTDIDKIKRAVSSQLGPLRKKYPSFEIKVRDADEQRQKTRQWAFKIAGLCFALILLILALILGSLTQPIIVGLAIPFGIIGIIWALFLHGMDLGIMSIIGLLGTAGVAVNDSLIMVHAINKLTSDAGKFEITQIIEGASSRLRAIVLTTVTTLGGVFPMAYGWIGESGFTQPLAFAIGWGLLFATLLTLFILPVLLHIRSDLQKLLAAAWGHVKARIPAIGE